MLSLICNPTKISLLQLIANKLDAIEINNPKMAQLLCRLIPSHCPFERDIRFCDRVLLHIPPMCKLNPFYEQLVGLRFKALCYLADVCGEDITAYC
ncbi:Mo-dependent nitrogenase C-terminal domain-containing protein [Cyanobacteria bacterium FACHB-DQ100]|uniref:Mo-dependent nitrogenase C-terminal domain-containing protein n=1 Tax=Leptolyngbya sp. DQ-M1 TaxID=2933920 RepID=UPI0019AA8B93|nr:Mo-dependent nitrogenase C-terminal domain-containing protein [Cyanobacteria bacterium FACHB-DQ100]